MMNDDELFKDFIRQPLMNGWCWRETVARVALVKPEKARAVEDMIIQNAMSGRLQAQVTEGELIRILEQVSQQFDRQVTVKFVRRRAFDEDEDEDEDS